MKNLQFALKASGSTLALVAATYFPTAALAQNAQAPDNSVEEVVVTGTSIRGATAPVGSNLITLGQQEIQNTAPVTVTEALANVPAITGMNNSGRGQNGNGGAGASVYIHEIGASAQNSTLVLMDGHRLPVAGSGNGNPVTDPNLIPEPMLQRVEVLADGSSSVYGSDAVSGVVNFITRKEFNGIELHYQGQAEEGTALGQFFSVLTGQSWDHGGFVAAYTYSYEDNIKDTTHWQTDPLLQPQRAIKAGDVGTNGGTTSFGTFNCDPATLQPGGTGSIYYSAAATAGVSNTAANAPQSNNCYASSGGNWAATDYLPTETRQNAMVKFNEQLGSSVTFEADAVWETKRTVGRISRGSLTATVFGGPNYTGTQANPFFELPAGYTGTASKETIRYDFDALFGPGATSAYGDDELMGDADLTWNINDDWSVDLLVSGGRSDSFDGQTNGVVNQGLALLALNGTNQTSGSLTTNSIAGINGVVTNLPLTTANALDVWNPAGTNRTSSAVLASLVAPNSNSNLNHGVDSYEQFRMIVNGTLFTTAAGAVKIAGGLERYDSQLYNYILTATNIGPTSKSAGFSAFNFGRTVTSEFLEADIPVVSSDMGIPLVRKLEFDFSARHDGYNDVGQTTNPKVSLNWDVVDGFRLRSSWSTSFVAVALEHDILNGQVSNASVTSGTPGALPVALYPQVTQLGIVGCTTASVTCDTSSLQGINSSGNTKNLVPERGRGWTLGFDFNPTFLEGFTSAVTWWHVSYLGGATAATPQIDAYNPAINNRIILFPSSGPPGTLGCATQAQLTALIGTAPINTVIPACVSTFTNTATDNLINFWASGIDATVGYHFDTDYGAFAVDDNISYLTQFLQGFGHQPPSAQYRFDVKNTVGLNTTFPNVGTQMRAHLGWALDPFTADLYMNFVGPYANVSGTATNSIGSTAFNVYNGKGGDHVTGQATFDIHLAYSFATPMFGQDEISLTAKNMFNSYPPYFNGTQGSNGGYGYDSYVSNPIGRIIEVGLDAKF